MNKTIEAMKSLQSQNGKIGIEQKSKGLHHGISQVRHAGFPPSPRLDWRRVRNDPRAPFEAPPGFCSLETRTPRLGRPLNERSTRMKNKSTCDKTMMMLHLAKHLVFLRCQAERVKKVLYFAYGSNMNPQRIKDRIPKSKDLGTAILRGYKLVERKFADVEAAQGSVVHGVLYSVTEQDLAMLDRYEGSPVYYQRRWVRVFFRGVHFDAVTYVMTDFARRERDGIPYTEEYRTICADGARAHGIPNEF